MKEYFGKTASSYQQTIGKKILLMPAVLRFLRSLNRGGKILDVGCGHGDYYPIASSCGFEYYGFDISPDMITEAKSKYPQGKYIQASAFKFSSLYNFKFDVILISMVLLCFKKKTEIIKVLNESRKLLKNNGKILIGIPYPCFDNYMRKGLFGKENVKTNFQGYFRSGVKYIIYQDFSRVDGNFMALEDFHWTLGDYLIFLRKAKLSLLDIDECAPDLTLVKKIDKKILQEKFVYPTYLLLIVGKTSG